MLKRDISENYACVTKYEEKNGVQEIGVIPLVVRNPTKVINIWNYNKCLSIAQRRIIKLKRNLTVLKV